MSISLKKGKTLSLSKGVEKVRIVLEWEENKEALRSFEDFDIDLIIIELKEDNKALSPDHLVFFNSTCVTSDKKFCDPEEAVIHSGDDRTGNDGGEECITYPGKLNPKVASVVYFANIYEGITKGQNFGKIKNGVVKVFENDSDIPKIVYELGDSFNRDTFLVIGKLEKNFGGVFKFIPVGEGNNKELIDNLGSTGLDFTC